MKARRKKLAAAARPLLKAAPALPAPHSVALVRREISFAEMVVAQMTPEERRLLVSPSRPVAALKACLIKVAEQATSACKWLQTQGAKKLSSRRLRVSETVSLGEKRFVSILQVDGTQFLIGTAAGQVSVLAVLEEPQRPQLMAPPQEQSA